MFYWNFAANFAANTVYCDLTALHSVKTKPVTGSEGENFVFKCEYPKGLQNYTKYFCRDDNSSCSHKIKTNKHNEWVNDGHFSLYDNTTAAFFIVTVDKLTLKHHGMYRCGVEDSSNYISYIDLVVSQGIVYHVIGSHHHIILTVLNYVTFSNVHHIKMCILFLVDVYFHR